jgi:FdhD protein
MKIKPNPNKVNLTRKIFGINEEFRKKRLDVIEEKPLTLYLNDQEIVTMMTVSDYPKYLAVGYLLNQNMITKRTKIEKIDYDDDLNVVVVRTKKKTSYQDKLKKKIVTSGCAQGTIFGDLMENFRKIKFNNKSIIKVSWIYQLSKAINLTPSLYLKAGAIHGCVLCKRNKPLIYMEDVGRHNAIDKIAGYMMSKKISSLDKIFYTTGRLTSEMVIKSVNMKIPVVISRSGFTAWGVELARQANLTLIGRAKGKKFVILSGEERVERS